MEERQTSPEDEIVEFENVTVKFQISESQIVAQVYPNCLTVEEIKKDIGRKFQVKPEHLYIYQENEQIPNSIKLSNIFTNDFGIVEVFLKLFDNSPLSTEENKPELNLQTYYNKFRLADFITVHIPSESGDDAGKNVVIEIQNQAITKPFIGGYRNIKTGVEFLDAFTQTGPPIERIKFDGIASREAQTKVQKDQNIATINDYSTQTFGDATKLIHVVAATDYVIYPKKYETYAEKVKRENKLEKIILIQRNFRRYLVQRLIKNAAAEYRYLCEEQKTREYNRLEIYTNRFKRECVRKAFPKTKEDFDLLYAQVQRWKEAEIKKITQMYSGGSRIAELTCLLDKEVQLLNGVEQQKNLVRKALKDFRDEQQLKKLGQPIKWIGYRNIVVEMDLIRTQRVRYLMNFYKDLRDTTKKAERIEVINKASEVLMEEDASPSITDLLDLFSREKQLLMMSKMSECDLDILRKRQSLLFVQIIKDEKKHKPKRTESNMCHKCRVVKPITDFALRTRQNAIEVCKRCYYLKNAASDRTIYKAIMRTIQRDERKRGALVSYAFIMQEDDIHYIIDTIWHCHSVLSQSTELADLRLPRWMKNEDWSPWNCVCLTESEARAHINITNVHEIYDETLIQDVHNKHLLAKAAFKKLFNIDNNPNKKSSNYKINNENKCK